MSHCIRQIFKYINNRTWLSKRSLGSIPRFESYVCALVKCFGRLGVVRFVSNLQVMHGVRWFHWGANFHRVDMERGFTSVRNSGQDFWSGTFTLTKRNHELSRTCFVVMVQVLHECNGDVFAASVEGSVTRWLASSARGCGQDTVLSPRRINPRHGTSLGRTKETDVAIPYCKKRHKHKNLHLLLYEGMYLEMGIWSAFIILWSNHLLVIGQFLGQYIPTETYISPIYTIKASLINCNKTIWTYSHTKSVGHVMTLHILPDPRCFLQQFKPLMKTFSLLLK